METSKYAAADLFFLDFSLGPSLRGDYDMWKELETLLATLKDLFVDGHGFWGNRNIIASDTKGLLIAIDRKTGKQVGFTYSSEPTNEDVLLIYIIQAFEEKRNVGTLMIEYLYDLNSRYGKRIVVDYPLEVSYPFWTKFLRSHPKITTNDAALKQSISAAHLTKRSRKQ